MNPTLFNELAFKNRYPSDYVLFVRDSESEKILYFFKLCSETNVVLDCKWAASGFDNFKPILEALSLVAVGRAWDQIKEMDKADLESVLPATLHSDPFVITTMNWWQSADSMDTRKQESIKVNTD